MAFDKTGFQPIGGQAKAGNAPQMWSYVVPTADVIADVAGAGYFNAVSDLLKVGDLIYAWDSSVPTGSFVVVLSNAAGVVDTSNATVITMTDSD